MHKVISMQLNTITFYIKLNTIFYDRLNDKLNFRVDIY